MKSFGQILLFLFFGITAAAQVSMNHQPPQALTINSPTNANIPEAKHVLVVYKTGDAISAAVKDHYVAARNIPAGNVVGLTLPGSVTYPEGTATLVNDGEVIQSIGNNAAWQYYGEYIADELETYLETNSNGGTLLKDLIRYIVLVRGVPMKIQTEDYQPVAPRRYNVSVDGLVCLLYQPVETLYGTLFLQPTVSPYFDVDPGITMNHRFLPHHYTGSNDWKLSYLVSRLDGDSQSDITGMIDRSADSDYSGEDYWVLDGDTCHNEVVTRLIHDYGYISDAHNELSMRSFNTVPQVYSPDCNWILDLNDVNPSGQVIGYTSCGKHSWFELGTCGSPYYILNCLNFNYANGAIMNTFESFNGFSMRIANRYYDFGLVADFIKMGGSGGIGYLWEPVFDGQSLNRILFPNYAMGYNFVDAAYQSVAYIAWQYVVVGDPLMAISWGKQTLNDDLTVTGTNLVTGEITVPAGVTLTVADNALVNIKFDGDVVVNGTVVVAPTGLVVYHNRVPALSSPTNGAAGVDVAAPLSWSSVPDGADYHVQVATDDQFTNIVFEDQMVAGTSVTASNLGELTQYYWRVRGKYDDRIVTIWSEVWSFTTGETTAPPAPSLLYPADDSREMPMEFTFDWNDAPDAETYRFQLATDNGFGNIIEDDATLTDSEKDINGLDDGTEYFWRVNASNTSGTGPFSPVYSFSTAVNAPSNLAATVNEPRKVNLTWDDNSASETGFIIERKPGDSLSANPFTLVGTPAPNTTAFTDSTGLADSTTYTYRVRAYNSLDTSNAFNYVTIMTMPMGLDELGGMPTQYSLDQNYPNPFNPGTVIRYSIPFESRVKLTIYSPLGEVIAQLVNDTQQPGFYEYSWNAAEFSSGIYFYAITAESLSGEETFTEMRKMLLLK